ncbi:MAG TPA: four-carbon acid sugar kinase family protein [Chitinophagaceae bacterium]
MIAVIADDLTGAAEIAGIGLRYDLAVELVTSVIPETGADLFVVCTDSRSLNKTDAKRITDEVMKEVLKLKPEFIYKKIDSVFRGHVLDELKIQMQQSGKTKALVLGTNPSLGRTIKNGNYFVNGDPISETDFETDPEFAIRDSSVVQMLRAGTGEVKVLKHTDSLPDKGIVIGEAVFEKDITGWATKIDNDWVLAGAGDFFNALLARKYKAAVKPVSPVGSPHLYVSGTAFGKSRDFIKRIKNELNCVAYMPAAMMQTGNVNNESWYNTVTEMLDKHKKAVIAIDDEDVNPWNASPVYLRTIMATAVKKILEKGSVKELFIEGGSTAASILNELDIKTLSLVNELERGVVRMKAKDLYITVKPGSYELPEEIVKLYLIK